MHLRHVHGLSFDFDPKQLRWLDAHRIAVDFEFDSPELGHFAQRVLVTGTNAVSHVTLAETESVGLFTSTPIGSTAQSYYVAGVPEDPTVEASELQQRLDAQLALGDTLLVDDARTLTGIRFQVGALVEGDRTMAKYMRWVDEFPKAAPARSFE